MNREIKFRAWSNDLKKMIREYSPCNNEGKLSFSIDNHYNDNCNGESDYNLIPMQYTGLKDKNGKEIYEGDILSAGIYFRCPVTFSDGCFQLISSPEQGSSHLCQDRAKRLEIIGNIYENPELL